MLLVSLAPWKERNTPELSQTAIQRKLSAIFDREPGAAVSVFGLPSIQGIGTTGGFSFVVEDTSGTYPERLEAALDKLVAAAVKDPAIAYAYTTFRSTVPQVFLKIDREKALKLGVPISSINTALKGLTGYTYVNDFNKFGKVYKVEIQADAMYRGDVSDVRRIFVRNNEGRMVPLRHAGRGQTASGAAVSEPVQHVLLRNGQRRERPRLQFRTGDGRDGTDREGDASGRDEV